MAEASRCSLQCLAPCTPSRAVPALPPAAPHGHSCSHRPGLSSSPGAPGTAPESPRPSCCCPGQPHTGPRGTALAPGWYQQPQSLPMGGGRERHPPPLRHRDRPRHLCHRQSTPPSHPLESPKNYSHVHGGSCDSHTCGRWRGQRHNPAALRRPRRVAKPFPASRYSPGGGTGAGSQQAPEGPLPPGTTREGQMWAHIPKCPQLPFMEQAQPLPWFLHLQQTQPPASPPA